MLDLFVIAAFLLFTGYFVYKFVNNDFKGIDVKSVEREKSDKLLKTISEIVERLPEKEREFARKNGEDFALQYFDLKVKEFDKTKRKLKRLKSFYFFSAVKLEGELIFLINMLKKDKKLLEKMKGIEIEEGYLKLAKEWEKECFQYFQ